MKNRLLSTSHFSFIIHEQTKACDFLSLSTGLSKQRIKEAMNKGAVWLKRPGYKEKRLRKASCTLAADDRLDLYYTPEILAVQAPTPHLVFSEKHFSVWFKPAYLLTQGTHYGDHCSLLRYIELYFKRKKQVFLIHRLDREAFGLVLVAHSKHSAAAFSRLFHNREITKRYRAEVVGKIDAGETPITITQPLDKKKAVTTVSLVSFAKEKNTSLIDILLQTGRYHQIRRHLSWMGHPIVGDKRYNRIGKTSDQDLQLCAYGLSFKCPFTGKSHTLTLRGRQNIT